MNISKGVFISPTNMVYLNLCNLVFFLIVAFTGSIIQVHYHIQGLLHTFVVIGLDKTGWVLLHKVSSLFFFVGLVAHCLMNWKFITTSTRRLFDGKPRLIISHSYLLLIISVLVCLTVMMSWIILGGEEGRMRFLMVETHDKLGWLLAVVGLIHIIQRSGRVISTFHTSRNQAMVGRNRTEYICFDSGMCKACWKCLEVCPKGVFGKINILIHKHIKVNRPQHCIGCRKCIKACSYGAISPIIVKTEPVRSSYEI